MLYDNADNKENTDLNSEQSAENPLELSLKECKNELAQSKERALYAAAEFENYKKRTEKERLTWIQAAQASVLLDLLPIGDDIERAFAQISPEKQQELGSWLQGFELIRKAYYKLLQKYGVEEMRPTGMFNPIYHEAISQVVSEKHQPGEIVSVFEKGYFYKGGVLRPAKVSVAQ